MVRRDPPRWSDRGDRARTCDLRFWRPPLYQLSYAPTARGRIVALPGCRRSATRSDCSSSSSTLGFGLIALAAGRAGVWPDRARRGGARRLDGDDVDPAAEAALSKSRGACGVFSLRGERPRTRSGAVAGLPANARWSPTRPVDPDLCAARQIRGRPPSAASLPAHVDDQDLVSYGLLGFIGAIERFDPDREIKFETYAISTDQGRHHRRTPLTRLGAAIRPHPRT